MGGIWGALATGLFATKVVNSAGADGLFYGGGFDQLWKQAIGVGVTVLWSGVMTFVILKVLDLVVGLRVESSEELTGLDSALHGESAYEL